MAEAGTLGENRWADTISQADLGPSIIRTTEGVSDSASYNPTNFHKCVQLSGTSPRWVSSLSTVYLTNLSVYLT